MNWGTILPAIQTLLVQLTGLHSQNVGDADSGDQKFTSSRKKGQLSFKVVSVRHIGRDESRMTEVLSSGPSPEVVGLAETVCGNREFTLQLLFEGFDHKFTRSAPWYLERIFTKLSRRTSKDALAAIDCSWTGVSPFVNLSASTSDDDRVFSRGARDFTFLTVVNDTDESEDELVSWIETVELYSNPLRDEGGEALPDALQVSFTGPPAP